MVYRIRMSAVAAVSTGLLLLLSAACGKDINNKEAVRAAVVEYLNSKASSTGLNVASMDIQVGSVSFEKDQAQAMVSIKPKGMAEGMQMTYALVRKGDKWEVKSKQQGAGGDPHGGVGGEIPPSPDSSNPALPPGHPPAAAPGDKK
jgi:hypothetical protein